MIRSNIWTVRPGTDGIGIDAFHVYAPDMATARQRAADGFRHLKMDITAKQGAFTVHQHGPRPWRPCLTPVQSYIARIPAMDFADMLREYTNEVQDLNLAGITA